MLVQKVCETIKMKLGQTKKTR